MVIVWEWSISWSIGVMFCCFECDICLFNFYSSTRWREVSLDG